MAQVREQARRFGGDDPFVIAWFGLLALAIAINCKTAPAGFEASRTLSDLDPAEAASLRNSLAQIGLTPLAFAIVQSTTYLLSAVISITISWLMMRTRERNWFVIYAALVYLAGIAATYPPGIGELLPDQPVWQALTWVVTLFAISGFFAMPFLFPNGRFSPRWVGPVILLWIAAGFFIEFVYPGDVNSSVRAVLDVATSAILIGLLLFSVVYRYRRGSTTEQRQQIRFVLLGFIIAIPLFFAGDWMMRHIGGGTTGLICLIGFTVVMPIAFGLPVVVIGLAILRYQLFDADRVLSQTLVWASLSILVTTVYVGIVVGVGSLFDAEGNLILALFATGLVAVGFQPVANRIRVAIRRFIYGRWDEPFAVFSSIGTRIEAVSATEELLSTIVRTIVDALSLPYASLRLDRPDGPFLATAGSPTGFAMDMPLTHGGSPIGTLTVGRQTARHEFSPADRMLLENLARQIAVAAQTVNLTNDLQHSREQIVTAREEERRRLRRDLHDGLGSQLAALLILTSQTRGLIRSDPVAADLELGHLRDELRIAVNEIRRIVQGLRPSALDELGLIGALEERLRRLDLGGYDVSESRVRIELDAIGELPVLSAAAEVAIYRIVEEAVVNIIKHANATRAVVRLSSIDGRVQIEVEDDGVYRSADGSSGVGIGSMTERAAELGGTLTLERDEHTGGTRLSASLPIAPGQPA